MNVQKYKWLFYLITITITATIALQFYWNYNNYIENKQRVRNEIQLSLDNAVEEYYSSLAKNNFLTIIKNNDYDEQTVKRSNRKPFDVIISKIKNSSNSKKNTKSKFSINSIQISSDENFSQEKIDSMMLNTRKMISSSFRRKKEIIKKEIHFDKNSDSSFVKYFKGKEE